MKVLFEGLTEEDIKKICGLGPQVREVARFVSAGVHKAKCTDCGNCGDCGYCDDCSKCQCP